MPDTRRCIREEITTLQQSIAFSYITKPSHLNVVGYLLIPLMSNHDNAMINIIFYVYVKSLFIITPILVTFLFVSHNFFLVTIHFSKKHHFLESL
jgi:hypothetical protein